MSVNEIKNKDGTQIDYESYVNYKERFNDSRTTSFTSSEYFDKKRKESRDELYDKMLYGGVAVASAKFAYETANRSKTLLESINNLQSSSMMMDRLNSTNEDSVENSIKTSFANPSARSLSNSIYSNMAALEELSPLHILKTLQISSFSTLFVEVVDSKNKEIKIGPDSIRVYEDYYRNLIFNNSGINISERDIERGFVLKDEKLFLANVDGKAGKELLGFASAVNTNLKVGEQDSPNRVFQKFANIHGVDTRLGQYNKEPIAIVGAKTKTRAQVDWMRSYSRFSMEIGYKVLDNPLGFIEEYASAIGMKDSRIFKSSIFDKVKKFTNISLGTGGVYNKGTRESMKTLTTNLGKKSLIGYVGYNAINSLLQDITPEESVWNGGIASGVAASYASARVAVARTWSDRLQDVKERQEEAAEGSTSLLSLAAVPMAGAMFGANIAYAERMKDVKKLGLKGSAEKHTTPKKFGGNLGKGLDALGMNAPSTTLRRYSKLGGIVGGLMVAPFLPGALAGRSSEELAREFSGEDEVAVKADRFWLLGGQAYEGGKTKYYRKSLIAETIKGAKDKSLYENSSEKRALDPIYSPFRYLKNPYAYEERHQDDQPYPVWGMDVTYGSFLGKFYQGTFGQIIKPDAVNPELESMMGKRHAISNVIKNLSKESSTVPGSYEEAYRDFEGGVTRQKAYPVPINEDAETKSLIDSGDMMASPSPINDFKLRSSIGMYTAGSDFTGMKGFAGNVISRSMGIDPEEQLEPYLAVSGSSRTAKKALLDMQLGDAGGAGEFLRRLIPQSSASDQDAINPLMNKVAPSWLPSNETKYYKNFKRGDYFNETTEHAETLLPSKGFAEMNPEVKGLDPEEYPLVYQYKILQNVARGSSEHITTRNYLLENLDSLSEREKEIFFESYEQEKERDTAKEFSEYATEEDKAKMGVLQTVQNAVWESFSHKEAFTEPLTPFRPMSKFMHQRTAIEDYRRTQLAGSDVGIWTKPVDHFIRPTKNRLFQMGDDTYKPKEAIEKENIDEYFDKLSLIKYAKEGNDYKTERTVTALSYTGIRDSKSLRQFKNALPDNQKDYVEAFAKETDAEKRKTILELVPTDIGRAYSSIWSNTDKANYAKEKGYDVEDFLDSEYIKETQVLQKNQNINLTSQEQSYIENKASKNLSGSERERFIDLEESKAVRLKLAEREAREYVENQTGRLPGDDWVGWDPRLSMDDVKLKALSVGKKDLEKYGYWSKDQQRVDRINILTDDTQIVSDIEEISRSMKANNKRKHETQVALRKQGFEASRINYIPSPRNAIRIVNEQDYLNNYEG